jgi:L-threonylcarbamoyladenylate synthase
MLNKIKKSSIDTIQLASRSLQNGDVIVMPTDTVYGLAAQAENESAVQKIFKIKNRPKTMPLIIFVRSLEEAKKIAKFNELDIILAKNFWPGPLTLILDKKQKKIYNGDRRLSKIGIRIPKNKATLRLLNYIKKPLATTSANLHKEKNEKNIKKLKVLSNKYIKTAIFSKEKMAFKESTLIATSSNEVKILRLGQVNKSQLRKVIKSHGYSHQIK